MNVSLKRVAITLVTMLSFMTASAQTYITTSTQTGQTQAKSSRVRFMEKPERVWPFEAELFYGRGTGFNITASAPTAVAHLDLSCVATLRTLAGMWARFYVMTLQAMTSPDMYPLPILITV